LPQLAIIVEIEDACLPCKFVLLEAHPYLWVLQYVLDPVGGMTPLSVEEQLASVIGKPDLDRPWQTAMPTDGGEIEDINVRESHKR
jgi:hypothetical protein